MIGTGCIFGRAPHIKETLPDFRELCRVTRHPRVFRELTGCQRDTPVMGHHMIGIEVSHNSRVPASEGNPVSSVSADDNDNMSSA